MFIYVITNTATGKVYIGQHKGNNLKKYLQVKLSQAVYELKRKGKGGGSYLFASMRKHPKDVWTIEPLFSGIETKAELDRLERLTIALYDTRNPEIGYNICKGGEGFSGTHTPEARAKVSAALRERWQEPGFRDSFSEKMTGHATSDETRGKIKAARAQQDEEKRTEGCREWVRNNPEEAKSRLSHEAKVLGGKAGSREAKQRAGRIAAASLPKAMHVRWHVNRGLVKDGCELCISAASV